MKVRTVLFTTLVLVLSTGATITLAQQQTVPVAEHPQFVPGERWMYDRNGERLEIVYLRQEDSAHIVRRSLRGNAELWHYSLDGNPIKGTKEDGTVLWENSGEYALHRFPLFIGKSWSESYYAGRARVHRTTLGRVTAYEQVKVQAGNFWAFRIELAHQHAGSRPPAYETLWYAPTAKRAVKHLSREFRLEIELLEYWPANSR